MATYRKVGSSRVDYYKREPEPKDDPMATFAGLVVLFLAFCFFMAIIT